MTFPHNPNPAPAPAILEARTCARCTHSRAYHDIPSGCYAWNPDQPNYKCACVRWQDPKIDLAPIEQKPGGHERADLQEE